MSHVSPAHAHKIKTVSKWFHEDDSEFSTESWTSQIMPTTKSTVFGGRRFTS